MTPGPKQYTLTISTADGRADSGLVEEGRQIADAFAAHHGPVECSFQLPVSPDHVSLVLLPIGAAVGKKVLDFVADTVMDVVAERKKKKKEGEDNRVVVLYAPDGTEMTITFKK